MTAHTRDSDRGFSNAMRVPSSPCSPSSPSRSSHVTADLDRLRRDCDPACGVPVTEDRPLARAAGAPSLIPVLSALPLLAFSPRLDLNDPYLRQQRPSPWNVPLDFLALNNDDRLFFRGRLPVLLLALLVDYFTYRWARERAGRRNRRTGSRESQSPSVRVSFSFRGWY